MDRKGGGKPPPGESGFFDLSKKSPADIAAEIAARMARWRQAHRRAEAPARAPSAGGLSAHPSAPASAIRPQELDVATAARIHRALRMVTQAHPPHDRLSERSTRVRRSYGPAFRILLDEGPNRNAIGLRPARDIGEAPPADVPRFGPDLVGTVPSPAPGSRVRQAERRAHALAIAARDALVAGGQATQAALVHGIEAAERRARAHGAAARARGSAAWRALAPVVAHRIDRARLRIHAAGVTARARGTAAWHGSMLWLTPRIDQAKQRLHAFGSAARAFGLMAWRAPATRLALAGVAAIAIAVAAWCLSLPHAAVPPDSAGAPAVPIPSEIAVAPAVEAPPAPVPAPSPPIAEAPSAPPSAAPAETVGFLAPMLKPPPPLPTLVATLKPAQKAVPTRQEQPEPKLLEGKPLPPLPQAKPSPASPEELRKRNDPRGPDVMLDGMLSELPGHTPRRKRLR